MSVRGRAAASAVAVEADPRTADPVTVAACEGVVAQGCCICLCSLAPASSLFFPLFLSSALLS